MTSESARPAPPRRRRYGGLGKLLAGLAILVLAFAVFGWPGGGADGGGPLNAIARAAEKTQQQPGGRAAMRALVSSPERSVTMSGRMVFDAEDRVRGVVVVPRPGVKAPVKVAMMTEGTHLYMRSSVLGPLPDGRAWVGLDMTLGQGEGPLPSEADAKGELEVLESATGGVEKIGSEDVHGIPTTRYRGVVPVAKQVENLREIGADDLASHLEEEGSPVQLEAWIDGRELVRRMRLVTEQPGEHGKGPTRTDMRMDFFDFGLEPEIEMPASDEVFDVTAKTKERLDRSQG